MTDWLLGTLLATSGLILLVLLIREPVRRHFGARVAYSLWLIPAARLLMPTLTETVERPAEMSVSPRLMTSQVTVEPMLLSRVAQAEQTLAEEREGTFTGLFEPDADGVPRIMPAQLAAQLAGEHPPLVLDVRARAHYDHDDGRIPGSVHVPPDLAEEWIANLKPGRSIVTYCL